MKPTDSFAQFAAACRAKGLSLTHQRQAVYEAVAASRSHPGAEEIYRTIRARYPTISRGTVYRTLETLCEIGMVSDVNRLRGTGRFEVALRPHHHLVCLKCRKIIDLHDKKLDRVKPSAPGRPTRGDEASGFEVTGHQIQFMGYCRSCRKAGGSRRQGKGVRRISSKGGAA